jgi:pantetheine-phosphate adenylyltransferase
MPIMKTIVYPGTFDPITNGHIDLVERSSKLFGKIVIGIAASQRKGPLFTIEERIELASEALQHVPNVEIRGFDYLLVTPAERFSYISSSLVREISSLDGDVSKFVPVNVANALAAKHRELKG